VAEFEAVKKTYEGALKSTPTLVSASRQIKTAEEVERIRAASALAEGVLADVTAAIQAGITERDLAAEFEYEFKRRGASGASFDTIALFGARSSLPHGAPGDTALTHGDIVLLDFGCRLDGYCSDLTRTYAFGRIPSPWFEEVYDLTLTAQTIALEAIRPGKTGREVDAVARDLITEAGYGVNFGHGLGHGVGIEIHEGPRLNKESDTTLVEGMIVTVEPGVYVPGKGGVRIEDLVVVTKDGCEILSSAPKELRVLGR
jgi:Xaa-Pro aminopeptidase